jgi:hypothetical protein
VFIPLGQETSPNCCCFQEKVHRPQHPAYSAFAHSPGFALVDFFLFWRVKEELTDHSLGKDRLKEALIGVIRTFISDLFATAIRRCFECRKNSIQIDVGYTRKS